MEEENSWLRRTKFSHTIYYRSGSSRVDSVPFVQSGQNTGFELRVRAGTILQPSGSSVSGILQTPSNGKVAALSPILHTRVSETFKEENFDKNNLPTRCPKSDSVLHPSGAGATQIQHNSSSNKLRALSPTPQTNISLTFKEAKSDRKRYSTPQPVRRDAKKGVLAKLLNKEYCQKRAPVSKSNTNIGALRHLSAMKIDDMKKNWKETKWTKYFGHAGGRVSALESTDEWEVDLSKLFLGLKFDHGAYSQLYHGIYRDEPVAVKISRIPDDDENGDLGVKLEKQFTREVTLLSRLHHQNVIKFVAACRKKPVFCVITEYLSDGSLRAYLRKIEQKPIPLQKINSMALDIARGMEFIHSQGIIHRDLKPENILINQDFQLKIADFGIACDEANCDSLIDDPGTFRWMAPEMLKRKSYSKKVDMYSFGLILFEMVSGTIPYKDKTPSQAAFAVLNKNLRPVIPEDCPSTMRALIEQCWSLHPDRRPEFWQVVKVLEQFESSLARDGTLNLVQNTMCHDLKKGLLHRMQKPGPVHQNALPVPKAKFT
ncbi:Serine/threonine-protein kinase HT1 [Heracleum sosnowskyi]|uniref:Serine/threonine-protein kinase HT1 n=1 Tax=Heracleum sosnowskyi TaxID=360622 RepID=A0AAD8MMY7_9APIA|nr:Serine/threonine-protein kinase HT1 [Heracleum sosnowskyi]